MKPTHRLAAVCIVNLLLCVACAAEYVTKDEFEKFLKELEKNKAETQVLKEQNAGLAKEVQALQSATKQAALDSKIDVYLAPQDAPAKPAPVIGLMRSGTTKFLMSGWADSGYEDRSGKNPTFTASFHPVFLWKLDDRISFESDLTYAVIDFHFDDLATLEAGKFLTPFGAFIRRQHQTWSNKLPDDPLALDINTGLVPSYTVGADVSGGFGMCSTRFNYSVYAGNGPKLNATSSEDFGKLDFNNDIDTNRSKAVGGRLGFLPIPDLEFAASFQASRAGIHHTPQSNVDAFLYGADMSYVNDFEALKGTVDIKAEWIWSRLDNSVYSFGGNSFFFTDDKRNGGYVQFAYRPTKADQKWLRNLELALRFDRLDNPDHGPRVPGASNRQFADHDRGTFGIDYWLGPTAVFKLAYEKDRGKERAYLLQFALGF